MVSWPSHCGREGRLPIERIGKIARISVNDCFVPRFDKPHPTPENFGHGCASGPDRSTEVRLGRFDPRDRAGCGQWRDPHDGVDEPRGAGEDTGQREDSYL